MLCFSEEYHIVNGMQAETLFNLSVRSEEDVSPSRDQEQHVESEVHNGLFSVINPNSAKVSNVFRVFSRDIQVHVPEDIRFRAIPTHRPSDPLTQRKHALLSSSSSSVSTLSSPY
jgi:hypothetical protein